MKPSIMHLPKLKIPKNSHGLVIEGYLFFCLSREEKAKSLNFSYFIIY